MSRPLTRPEVCLDGELYATGDQRTEVGDAVIEQVRLQAQVGRVGDRRHRVLRPVEEGDRRHVPAEEAHRPRRPRQNEAQREGRAQQVATPENLRRDQLFQFSCTLV